MIRVKNLTMDFQLGSTVVHALRDVTLSIPAGSFQFILGPSGSGKSTLLYLLGALDRPTSGSIEVAGQRFEEMTTAEQDDFRRHEVGFVFQNYNLLGNLTALDNVLAPFLPLGVSSELRARAASLLGEVGLADRVGHRPRELSGGEQQRVAIARALLKEPQLVLADEPTGELDHATGSEVMQCLRQLQQSLGTTVVVVTHDESYVGDGDAVLRLRDGQLVDTQAVGD